MTKDELKDKFTKESENRRPLSLYLAGFGMTREDLRALQGKKILLVGGGDSSIAKDLRDAGIDAHVVNIDPYTTGFDPNNATELVDEDFFDAKIKTDEYDQVWASHSLPMYSKDDNQVAEFYAKSILALAPGGTLRVSGIKTGIETGRGHTDVVNASNQFFKIFNEKFPNYKLEIRADLYVLDPDKSIQKNNPVSVEEYFEKRDAAILREERINSSADNGSIRLKKTTKNISFRAPTDKRNMNLWLGGFLNKLKTHENYMSRAITNAKSPEQNEL